MFAATLRDDGEPVRPITATIAVPIAEQEDTAEAPSEQDAASEHRFAIQNAGARTVLSCFRR